MSTGALAGVSMGMGLGSAIAGAESQRLAGKFNQDVSNLNASISESRAEDAEFRGELAIFDRERERDQRVGAQRAAYAGQNVDVNTGTAAEIQAQTEALAAEDVERIRYNAAMEAWGYRMEGADSRLRGTVERSTGDQQSMSTALTGASQAAYRMYGFSSKPKAPAPGD
jgi:hypothetical protein